MAKMGLPVYEFNEDGFNKMRKDLNFLFKNLDHSNVKRLYTEYCDIQSENGETIISGPLMTMLGTGSTTVRMKLGYDEVTDDFIFNLFNTAGVTTISLDANGDALFTGTITAGAVISGAVTEGGTMSSGFLNDCLMTNGNIVGTSGVHVTLSTSLLNNCVFTGGSIVRANIASSNFACNGANPQDKYSVDAVLSTGIIGSTVIGNPKVEPGDLITTNNLVNQIRQALINNGILV